MNRLILTFHLHFNIISNVTFGADVAVLHFGVFVSRDSLLVIAGLEDTSGTILLNLFTRVILCR